MGIEELLEKVPKLGEYIKNMPEELKTRYTIRTFPPGHIIHQKDEFIDYFGILCIGSNRVINEFENGNVYMIEKNEAIDFIGEVTLLAGYSNSSVTIETLTECTILFITKKDCEKWFAQDSHFLRLVAKHVAYKLYRTSYTSGVKLFFPPSFLVLDYLIHYVKENGMPEYGGLVVKKTRQELFEEIGITVKTINRTVKKLVEEDGLIGLYKGKITISSDQYQRILEEIKFYAE